MIEDTILKGYRSVAVVGLSPDLNRASHRVAAYLAHHGYEIIPVNPNVEEMLGMLSYPDLQSLPQSVEIVDIFRRSEEVPPIVDEAIKIGAKVVWMQEGITNEEAAAKARDAGLLVVMDKCMLKEHRRLSKEPVKKGGRK